MRRDEALQILSEHRAEVSGFGVKSFALFGSVARDEAAPGSDVDILVEFEPQARVGLFALVGLREYLEGILGSPVDLVSRDAVKRQLRGRIFGEAVSAA